MIRIKTSLLIAIFFLLTGVSSMAQQTISLPRAAPETEGVSSEGITKFLDAIGKSRHELHSFMLLRHGQVIAEGWWKPYAPALVHTMYSTSKSFTATAIGFAVSEKKLDVRDKVISFFPGELPDTVSRFLSALTVQDLLSMSAGQEPDPTFSVLSKDSNWVKAFLAFPIVHQPGTTFLYNTLGSYMLSAILQKATGEREVDYLKPRLFQPLGISGVDWEQSPMGINTGGWGLRLKTEDMAKFGQLFLQKGKWNGQQVLSPEWINEATSIHIIQHPDLPQQIRDSSDWEQGYGYQMWRCRHHAFRADGAFGQFIIVMPDEDAVIAITAETADMQDEINLIWEYLLPAMHKGKLPVNKNHLSGLKQKLATLQLPVPGQSVPATLEKEISAKAYTVSPNEMHMEQISFHFKDKKCLVDLKKDAVTYTLAFGLTTWQAGETAMRGPNLISTPTADYTGFPSSKVAGSYRWKDEHTLELTLRFIESPHTETITCHFNEDKVTMDISKSLDYGKKVLILNGISGS